MEILLILIISLLLDLVFGEPPNAIHPVAWMGRLGGWLIKGARRFPPAIQFVYGSLMVLFIMSLFGTAAWFLMDFLYGFNTAVYILAGAVLLKITFSLRGLRQAALRIKKLLLADKLEESRFELRALVSRDSRNLSREGVVSAAVESVAENASDSFVAPLFYFLIFGVPGAVAYRAVNTLDAMLGYHGRYEYLGKFAARLDDVFNYIPARLTALLLVLAAFILRRHGRLAWQTAWREHARTESPNAGWSMAAAAGALGVRLEKEGAYQLGAATVPLEPPAIDGSLKLVQTASIIWVAVCLAAGGIRFALGA